MSMMNVTDQLAKLMAQENLTVIQSDCDTASFDTAKRILTLPRWVDIHWTEEELLVGHEIGHALFTDSTKWLDSITSFPGSKLAFKRCMNVVEDARIERMVKSRYPGMRKIFFLGYSKLINRDIFSSIKKDLKKFDTVDFINAYFKFNGILPFADIKPSVAALIARIEKAETFDDVIALSHEIYALAKSEYENKKADPNFSNFNPPPSYSSSDEDDNKEGSGNPVPTYPVGDDNDFENEVGKTDSLLDDLSKLCKDSSDNKPVYFELPTPNLKNIIVPYKQVFDVVKNWNSYNLYSFSPRYMDEDPDPFTANLGEFSAFVKQQKKVVDHFSKIFEMRKKAIEHKKTFRFRSGTLDTNQIYRYKYDDQIFKTHEVKESGKNHGLIFFLDLSGSMSTIFSAAVKQMLQVILFCRQTGIPYVAYGFAQHLSSIFNREDKSFNPSGKYDNYFNFNTFNLIEMFSSEMSISEFKQAYKFYTEDFKTKFGLGSTPLTAAVAVIDEVVSEFKTKTNVQAVNVVFLTDGDSDIYSTKNIDVNVRASESPSDSTYKEFIMVDPKTKKQYSFQNANPNNFRQSKFQTAMVLKLMKDRLRSQKVNIVNFFICDRVSGKLAEDKIGAIVDKNKKMSPWTRSKEINEYFTFSYMYLCEPNGWGYDELFYVSKFALGSSSSVTKNIRAAEDVDSLRDAFMNANNRKKRQATMISSFIDKIV